MYIQYYTLPGIFPSIVDEPLPIYFDGDYPKDKLNKLMLVATISWSGFGPTLQCFQPTLLHSAFNSILHTDSLTSFCFDQSTWRLGWFILIKNGVPVIAVHWAGVSWIVKNNLLVIILSQAPSVPQGIFPWLLKWNFNALKSSIWFRLCFRFQPQGRGILEPQIAGVNIQNGLTII